MKQQLNRLKCAVLAALTMGLALGAEAENVAEVTINGTTTKYSDLSAAWAACKDQNATLKLLKDVDITSTLNKDWNGEGNDLVLDLGGHTLKQTSVTERLIDVLGKLTVTNGVLTRSVKFSGSGAGISVYYYEDDESVLTRLVMRDVTMTNCVATGHGAAIYAAKDTQVLLENCTLRQNVAGGSGGAIYSDGGATAAGTSPKDPWDKLVLISTVITDNTAVESGAGVYYKHTIKGDSCFAAGTKVLMADGSEKVIEEVEEGDIVRTFDHEGGTNSIAEVFLTVKEPITTQIFVLAFADGYSVRCVLSHDFLMKDGDTCKYVCLSRQNAADYVGKSFYAADGRWHELLSVTDGETVNEVYEIYSAKHLNSYADGLLTVPTDVAHVLNIYKLGADLKADAEQLATDIAAYGLADYDEMSAKYGMSRTYYDAFGVKYGYVIVGKGLLTLAQIEALYQSTAESTDDGRASTPSSPKIAVSGAAGVRALPLLSAVPKLAGTSNDEDPLADYPASCLTLGTGTIVTNNLVDSKPSNIYLDNANSVISPIALANDRAGICAGVTSSYKDGRFTVFNNAWSGDVALFRSDKAEYAVWYEMSVDGSMLKLASGSQVVPPAVTNTSYEIWEGDEIIAWNEGTTVEKYSNVKVIYTADDGYVFAGGATTKEVSVDTSKSIATMTSPDAPILLIEYTAPVYKGSDGNPTNGIERWETKSVYNYTTVESSASAVTWGEAGVTNWYVVKDANVQIDGGVTCAGHVNLILCEGAKLTVTNVPTGCAGIATDSAGSFTVYGQPDGAGELEVYAGNWAAGIGGGSYADGKYITINGGRVKAVGGFYGAGIGGGDGVLFDEVLKDVAGYPKRYGTPEAKLATEIFYVWLRQFLRVESDHPAWFEKLDLGAVPHEWRPQVGYLAVKRLERLREFAAADVLANALLNLVPSKAMLGSAADIHLKLALAQIARERGRMDESMRWCRETVVSSKARDIALPFLGKMMGPKSALEIAFVELAPDLLKRIKKGTNDYFRNLVRFHNRFSGESVSEELKPREFYLACSLKRGLRYKEIAERLGVSTNRVHAMAKDVYTTLGVRGASAIGKRVW